MSDVKISETIVNPGAERVIISNCMTDIGVLVECQSEGLLPKHFAIEANKIIYSAIVYLYTENANVDALSIINIIKDNKAKAEIDAMGGLEYIMTLEQSPKTYNINMFLKELMNNYAKRRLHDICALAQRKVIESKDEEAIVLSSSIEQELLQLSLESSRAKESYKMGEKLQERLNKAKSDEADAHGLATGWQEYDKVTNGAIGGDLIIVCAESKTGKSVTLLNWAKHIAIDQRLPILWIDTEQSDSEQEWRLLSIITQIPEEEFISGFFAEDTGYGTTKEKLQKINQAKLILAESQFYHIAMPDFTLEKIRAVVKQFYLKHGIVAVFFDYIKLTETLSNQNRNMRDDVILTTFANGLKALGSNLNIPVFTANQLNRSGYGNKEQDAKSIGGSIGVLQEASKLIFLRNLQDDEIVLPRYKGANQLLTIKYQRHGKCNYSIPVHFDQIRITQREVYIK